MSVDELQNAAQRLRQSFDRAFAAAVAGSTEVHEDFLMIRAAGDRYALRLSQIAGLIADRPLVPMPSPLPEFLGLVGIRGRILPVYAFGQLLGSGSAPEATRWLVHSAGEQPVAFAFEQLEGLVRTPSRELQGSAAVDERGLESAMLESPAGRLPVVNVPSVVEAIGRRLRTASQGA